MDSLKGIAIIGGIALIALIVTMNQDGNEKVTEDNSGEKFVFYVTSCENEKNSYSKIEPESEDNECKIKKHSLTNAERLELIKSVDQAKDDLVNIKNEIGNAEKLKQVIENMKKREELIKGKYEIKNAKQLKQVIEQLNKKEES